MLQSLRAHTGIAVALVLPAASALPAPAARPTASHTVVIENLRFSPAVLVVRRGDRIVWVNKDLFPHTVTADVKAFDSKAIDAGGSWTYVANQRGEYPYSCAFHPGMKATLKVR